MPVRSYQDLAVWQRSVDLAVVCHEIVKRFPSEERYALTSQVRRSSVSVPSNIAEGNASGFRALYASHVGRSQGSLAELETQMTLAERFRYLQTRPEEFWELSEETSRMLVSLRRRLRADPSP
jgi:four helix bundle protein